MTRDPVGLILSVLRSAAVFAALFVLAPAATAEGEVEIRSRDGALTVAGRVLGYDGRYLRLETAQGELTLDYDRVSCAGPACPDAEAFVDTLRFSGSGRLGGLILPSMVEGYARARGLIATRADETLSRYRYDLADGDGVPVARLVFQLAPTEDGFADLIAQRADIVMADRAILPAEATAAEEAGLGQLAGPARVRILAFDALVPVAAPGLGVSAISLEDLARAYAGEVTRWDEIGGPDLPISLHLSDPSTGLAQGFVARVLEATGRSLAEGVTTHPGDAAVTAAVIETPGALGLASFEQPGMATVLALRGSCGLRLEASVASVRTGDYPLTMPLFLYLPVRRLGPVGSDFLDWLATSEAQLVLRRIGVPGQEAVPIPIDEQGARLAAAIARAGDEVGLADLQRMVATVAGHDRLSPTFRFEAGQSQLDPASRSHVRSLAQAIRDGRHAGQDLLLLGFSDGQGPAASNQRLSALRAVAVRQAVLGLLGGTLPPDVTVRTMGMGEVLPIGCDDTGWGQQMNRRVELWAPAAARR